MERHLEGRRSPLPGASPSNRIQRRGNIKLEGCLEREHQPTTRSHSTPSSPCRIRSFRPQLQVHKKKFPHFFTQLYSKTEPHLLRIFRDLVRRNRCRGPSDVAIGVSGGLKVSARLQSPSLDYHPCFFMFVLCQ